MKKEVEIARALEDILGEAEEQSDYTDRGTTAVGTVPAEILQKGALVERARLFAESAVGYKELCMMYTCAIKEIRTKFEVLNTEFSVRYRRNPIYCISSRLKSTASILQKMERLGLPFTLDNIEQNLHDVAGVRVICSYTDDIYRIAESLLRQNDIELVTRKDYIANPKPNGYRSLHLIVTVPVFFASVTKKMQVEVQIRTIAMDYWASLEHQLKYKQNVKNAELIASELQHCADVIAETDGRMLALRTQIEQNADEPDADLLLLEKLSRLDVSLH